MDGSWWALGLLDLTVLFVLLLVLTAGQWLQHQKIVHILNEALISAPIPKTALRSKPSLTSSWMTRIFVVIVLHCAILSLLSQHSAFQSPLWLGLILQGFTYASAFVYYIVIRDKGLEEDS